MPIAITIAAVSALLLACGGSYPSESTGRRWAEANISPGFFTLKSFTKTNGFGDDKSYTMEYKAETECQKVIPGYCLKVGQVISQEGKITFQKTENGWRADDGRIY